MRTAGRSLLVAAVLVTGLLVWRLAGSASRHQRAERSLGVSVATAPARRFAAERRSSAASDSERAAPDSAPARLSALQEQVDAAQDLAGRVCLLEDAVRRAARKGTEEERRKLEGQLSELRAEEKAQAEARRRARTELQRWLVEDPGRPLELYRLLRARGSTEGLGRAGRLLAGYFDNSRLEAAVLDDLRSSPDEAVRGLALDVVSARPSPARLAAVTRLAGSDASAHVRVRAVGVLHGYQGDRRMLAKRGEIERTLLDAAGDEDAQVRIRALVALAGAPQPTKDMAVVFQKLQAEDPDLQVRTVAKQALRRWSTGRGE
jgi:hypothetical protein